MKFKNILFAAVLSSAAVGLAQSPVSGFMSAKGKGAIAISYSSEKYNEVYLVPSKVDAVPVFNDVVNTAINLYATYGITDKLEAVLSLPYIQSKGNGQDAFLAANGFENKRSGVQDVSAFVKYKVFSNRMTESTLDLLLSAGVQTPVGSYNADEGLQSIIAIGNKSTKGTGLAIAQIKLDKGLFLTGQVGYRVATNQVPNAVISEIKAGYAASKIYLDVWAAFQNSSKGTDILQPGFNGFFPATQVNYSRVGGNIYAPIYKGFGANLGFNAYVSGRNLGKSTGYSASLVYNY